MRATTVLGTRKSFVAFFMGTSIQITSAMLHQYSKESVADFVFHFCVTCLKIDDLSDAEKLDRFVHVLVPKIQLQVELRGPLDFHEVAMFVEHGDAVISRVARQDAWKPWQKQLKKGP